MSFLIEIKDLDNSILNEITLENYNEAWNEFNKQKCIAKQDLRIVLLNHYPNNINKVLFIFEGNMIKGGVLKRFWRDDYEEFSEEIYPVDPKDYTTRTKNGISYIEDPMSEEYETTELIDVQNLYVNQDNDYFYKGLPLDQFIVHKA